MLDIDHSDEAKSISTRSALWESNSSAPIAANVDKFKKSLTDSEINIIETITGGYMDYYGYERITKGNANVGSAAIKKAKKNTNKNKEKAWENLKLNDPKDYILRKSRADYIGMVRIRLLREKEMFRKTA